jgi:hypothetical protein
VLLGLGIVDDVAEGPGEWFRPRVAMLRRSRPVGRGDVEIAQVGVMKFAVDLALVDEAVLAEQRPREHEDAARLDRVHCAPASA